MPLVVILLLIALLALFFAPSVAGEILFLGFAIVIILLLLAIFGVRF
jgi:hypothetical protein